MRFEFSAEERRRLVPIARKFASLATHAFTNRRVGEFFERIDQANQVPDDLSELEQLIPDATRPATTFGSPRLSYS